MISFGPVPSRRLGQSLGVNNIPPKVCSYACVYCQLGKAIKMQVNREEFYSTDLIQKDVEKRIRDARSRNEKIDYLCIVPDGEPTLEVHLADTIDFLNSTGIKTAVISNASLVDRQDVREDLSKASWVSLKVDAVSTDTWKKINRPHRALELDRMMDGIKEFAASYNGVLATETMLVKGINDDVDELQKVAAFIGSFQPDVAYVSIPTRPPAEKSVELPDEDIINRAFQVFSGSVNHVEYLIGYEGNTFAFTGNVEEDILSITSVHPMRQDAVEEFLEKSKSNWHVIRKMIEDERLVETEYGGKRFYMRKL